MILAQDARPAGEYWWGNSSHTGARVPLARSRKGGAVPVGAVKINIPESVQAVLRPYPAPEQDSCRRLSAGEGSDLVHGSAVAGAYAVISR
ncbi:MAG: hypothetical protein NVSMB25_13320 [Thermoleophilaceae bacterium]